MEEIKTTTVYVQNIFEKLNLTELKLNLSFLMSQYGRVLDVVVQRKNSMRGQAFVVFKENSEALEASKMLNGALFFGKRLKLQLSKEPSHSKIIDAGIFSLKKKKEAFQGLQNLQALPFLISVENMPENFSKERFEYLFKSLPGYKYCKLNEGGIGLVEFDSIEAALKARDAYQGFAMDDTNFLQVKLIKN